MKPIRFKEANKVYKMPGDNTGEGDLPAYVDPILKPNEVNPIVSCWELSKEELELVNQNGGRIMLYVLSTGMPPVAMSPAPLQPENENPINNQ